MSHRRFERYSIDALAIGENDRTPLLPITRMTRVFHDRESNLQYQEHHQSPVESKIHTFPSRIIYWILSHRSGFQRNIAIQLLPNCLAE